MDSSRLSYPPFVGPTDACAHEAKHPREGQQQLPLYAAGYACPNHDFALPGWGEEDEK